MPDLKCVLFPECSWKIFYTHQEYFTSNGVILTSSKILIVEDDRIIANLTELRLNKIGHEVAAKIENPHLVMDYLHKIRLISS